jgi:hypothetical protein
MQCRYVRGLMLGRRRVLFLAIAQTRNAVVNILTRKSSGDHQTTRRRKEEKT